MRPLRVTVLAACLAALAPSPIFARTLYSYDLDSLTYMAKEIVRVKIDRDVEDDRDELAEVTVSEGFKGTLTAGTKIHVECLGSFREPVSGELDRSLLKAGRELVLFLVDRYEGAKPVPEDWAAYRIFGDGVKLVDAKNVRSFGQIENPGPYVLDTGVGRTVALEDFRARLKKSVDDMKAFAEQLRAAKEDMPDLVKLARARLAKSTELRDLVLEEVCARVADRHAVEPTLDLLPAVAKRSWHARRVLEGALATREGRDALLRYAADEARAKDARLMYAEAIGAVEPSRDTNEEYLTRIARLASSTKDEALAATLLESFGHLADSVSQLREQHSLADMEKALPVLGELHEKTASERLSYLVEYVTHRANGSKGRSVIAFVSSASVDPEGLRFEYTVSLGDEAPRPLACDLVVKGEDGSLRLPFALPSMKPGTSVGGSDTLALEKPLAKGKYRVFLAFRCGDEAVAEGHYSLLER